MSRKGTGMKRNAYADYLKGIGIVLVVMGHCWIIPSDLYKYIYSFHMPLFFMITGYFSTSVNKQTFARYSVQKIKSIYLPYIFYYLLSLVLTIFIFKPEVSGAFFEQTVKGIIFSHTYANVNNFALWYLPLLLLASLGFYFIKKLPVKIYYALMLVLFFAAPYYQQLFLPLNNKIPFSIHVLLPALFCMGCGDIFRTVYPKIALWNKYIIGVTGVAFFCAGLYLTFKNPQQILYINSITYLLAAVMNVIVLLMITGNSQNKILVYVGQRTLTILGIHRILIAILQKYNFDYVLGKMNLSGTMATLLITVIVILVCLAIHEAINKLYKAVSHKE